MSKDDLIAYCNSLPCNPGKPHSKGVVKDVFFNVMFCPDCKRSLLWKKVRKKNYTKKSKENDGKYF